MTAYHTDPAYRRTKSGRWEVRWYEHTPPRKTRRFKGGFRTRADAARWFGALCEAATAPPRSVTLGEFATRYLAHKLTTVRSGTAENDTSTMRRLVADMGIARPLNDITTGDVEAWLSTLSRGLSAHTVNSHLRRVRTALSAAVRWGLLSVNPALAVARRRTVEAAIVHLSREEQVALVRAARADAAPYAYPLVVLALRTGLRRGELLSLRWRDVDTDSLRLTVRTTDGAVTKSGRSRVVGLDADALAAVEWWREWFARARADAVERAADPAVEWHARRSAEFQAAWLEQVAPAPDKPVFPSFPVAQLTPRVVPMAEFRKTWSRLVRVAFGPRRRVRFHDLRHTFAVECARAGVPVALLSQLLGHASLGVTQVYLRFAPDAGAAAALAVVPALNCGPAVGAEAGCCDSSGE